MNALNHEFSASLEDQDRALDHGGATTSSNWLDRYSISAKIRGAVFGIAIALTTLSALILGVSHYLSLDGDVTNQIRSAEIRIGQTAMALAEARESLPATGTTAPDRAAAEVEIATETLASALEQGNLLPEDIRARLNQFEDRTAALGQQVAALKQGGSANTASRDARSEISGIQSDLRQYSKELNDYAENRIAEMFATIATWLGILLVLLVTIPLAAFYFARKVVQNVAGIIVEITDSMERISTGEIEAAIPGRDRDDEIGAMARALAIFRKTARREISRQREIDEERAKVRAEKDEALRQLAASFEETVGDVATSIGAASTQLQATATAMAGTAELTHQQTKESAAAMNDSSGGVAAAASASDEFALSIGEVSRQAAASAQLARSASQLATDANGAIGALSQDAVEIGEIVELIQSIAQRTNLLALNASIEAARSGEAGRGFAVVASEVKELAARTAEATDKVSTKISAIQNSTGTSVSALASIQKSIGELEHTAISIASAVDQQSVASQELARNIDSAARSADAVSSRLGNLNEIATETRSSAADVLDSSHQLERQARTLKDTASAFLSSVLASAAA